MRHVTGAVEDDTLLGECLSQILRRLGLSGSSRSRRGTTKVKIECAHKSDVADISEGRDDEATSVTEVFVTIGEHCGDTLSHAVINVELILLPVVTELLDPFEGFRSADLLV